MKFNIYKLLLLASLGSLAACSEPSTSESTPAKTGSEQIIKAQSETIASELVVYSSRKEHLIKPLFEEFTKQTGIKVSYITDKAGPLIARLKAEGERSKADIFMTVDAGNLWFAKQQGLLQPIDSALLETNIPEHLQDPENHWYGLTVRARTLVYSTERVKASELLSYEDLANKKWQGRLCLRTSKKVYNQSLVAMLIARHGEEKTESLVQGWVNNLATAPFSNDTKVMKAIEAGQCDVGIVNSYYFGRLQKENPQLALALYLPAKEKAMIHVNVSGAGITKHSKNTEAAQQLLEWLSSSEAQQLYAGLNLEYPANPSVDAVKQVKAWGALNGDSMNLSKAGELQPAAIKLMDRAGYK